MKRALIFLNGNYSTIKTPQAYVAKDSFVICADGGTKLALRYNIVPHVIIGDLDSIDKNTKKKLESYRIKFISYPREKDYADGELAIQYAVTEGYKNLIIYGVLGDRLDHLISNINQYALLSKKLKLAVVEAQSITYFVYDNITISGSIGDEVSLIPMQMNCEKVMTKNLKYPLTNETLFLGSTRGVSNVMQTKVAKISVKKGVLMVVHRRVKKV